MEYTLNQWMEYTLNQWMYNSSYNELATYLRCKSKYDVNKIEKIPMCKDLIKIVMVYMTSGVSHHYMILRELILPYQLGFISVKKSERMGRQLEIWEKIFGMTFNTITNEGAFEYYQNYIDDDNYGRYPMFKWITKNYLLPDDISNTKLLEYNTYKYVPKPYGEPSCYYDYIQRDKHDIRRKALLCEIRYHVYEKNKGKMGDDEFIRLSTSIIHSSCNFIEGSKYANILSGGTITITR